MLNNIFKQFSQTVQQFSDKTAVIAGNEFYTYHDLLEQSEKIALSLQDTVNPGDKVGVIYSRNHELIAIILAVLRVGGCYVPIDPRYPKDRINYIIKDANIKNIICRPEFQELVPNNIYTITFDAISSKIPNNKIIQHQLDMTGTDLAYIIYTSGTTGQPKGVMIQNNCVPTLLTSSLKQGIEYNEHDIWTMFHSYAFDFSIWEIFGAILTGGTLHIINNDVMRNINSFYEYLKSNHISMLSLTPSVFKQLIKIMPTNALPELRYIIFGGERFDLIDYQKWLHISPNISTKLVNMYGITETTVHTTLHILKPDDINIYKNNESPIGIALKHFEIFLLDDSLQPVKEGKTGEIYIAGNALASGYLNKPDLTAERFITIPSHLGSKYTSMYKSGDLAYKLNGVLCYKGRSDNQVKLRGYRIELDEIEKVILKIPTIKNSSVMVNDHSGLQILVAFYESDSQLNEKDIKKFINELLPSYMVPDEVFYLKKIPVNINGKVNKVKLQELYHASKSSMQNDTIDLNNKNQKLLLQCWRSVLGNKVPLMKNSNFFKSGGYSLLTFNLLAEINKTFNVDTKMGFINSYPVFNDMLEQINNLPKKSGKKSPPEEITVDVFPATYNQRALYYTCGLQGSNTYNICFEVKFNKFIPFDILQLELTKIINLNQELRTTFSYINGVLNQKILPVVASRDIIKFHNINVEEKEQLLKKLSCHVFNLEGDYLFDFHYIKTSTESSLFLNIHHTIFDGTSLNLLLDELINSLVNQKTHTSRNSFFNYSKYQQDLLNDNQYLSQANDFWNSVFSDDVVSRLKFNDVKIYNTSHSTNHFAITIENNLIMNIDNVCSRYNVSPYTFYLLAYGLLLNNYTGETKFAVGVPYANRPIPYIDTYGYFINTLPMVFDFTNSGSAIIDIFKKLNMLNLKYMRFQELPLSMIINNHTSSNINSFFAYQRGISSSYTAGDLNATLKPIYNGTAKFDLFLAINELDNSELEVAFEFEQNALSLSLIQKMANSYIKLISVLANSLLQPHNVMLNHIISLINDNEKSIMKGDTHIIENNNLIVIFKKTALKNPDAVALFDENKKITYNELDVLTDELAQKLIYTYGNHPNKLIGMYFRRDINMPIYILAILKAGFAYIPLNEEFPQKRIEYIRELCNPAVILTNINEANAYLHINDFNNSHFDNNHFAIELPNNKILANSLAYIMFTSGTTGHPKGVSLGHKSLASRITWMQNRYKLSSADTIFMKTPFNFDVSCGEIFTPLACGAKLFVSHYLAHKNIEYMIDRISTYKITHIYFVPTMLNIFLQFIQNIDKYKKYDFSQIKTIFCSGEALNQTIVNECYRLFPNIQIYNQYGPTEAGEVSDYLCKLDDKYKIVPIGNPINNTTFIVVNKSLQPVSHGIPGELLIAGECLADGYYNQESLTQQKFVYFPEIKQIVYKTGDLVVYDQDNNLCFLERMDNQAKINGIRIELAEIEQSLLMHNLISQAFVCIHKEEGSADKLIAFYITKTGEELNSSVIREFLMTYLPQYSLPTHYFYLNSIPTTINGKIDKSVCIKMFKEKALGEQGSYLEFEKYNSEEQKIISIWAQLLNQNASSINLDDNFLLNGGSSLLISRLILELDKQLNFQLNMFDIINEPTLCNLLNLYNNGKKQNIIPMGDILAADILKYSSFQVSKDTQPLATKINAILVTGASGFIGRHVLESLREDYPQAQIICMQRNSGSLVEDKQVKLIKGDLEEERFGLPNSVYNDLKQNVDVIIHIAATVNHLFGYNEHKKGNVVATRDLINLALSGKRKQLVFISTTGARMHNIAKTDALELNSIKDYGGYVLSKMIAEKLIHIAIVKHNLCASILRLGFVGPDAKNYDINSANNHIYALFKGLYLNHYAPDNFGDFECLLVNDVAKNIVRAIKNGASEVIEIANQQTIPWSEVYKLFHQISGIDLTIINKNSWIKDVVYKADPIKDDYLYKLIPLYNIAEDENIADTNKTFKLEGNIASTFSYREIVKSYINAIKTH